MKPRIAPVLSAFALAASALLAACSSSPAKPEPAALAPLAAKPLGQLWKAELGEPAALLSPVLAGGQLVAASASGALTGIDAGTGRPLWRVALGAPVAVGVGSDGQTSAAITTDNELVAVADGKLQWRLRLGARVFTPPLVAGQRVFVLAGDRSVSAFDARSGARLWSQAARNTDSLVLQQGGVISAFGDTLVVGISGRLSGLNPANGSTRWEAPVATPRGVNEIERLVDLVGPIARVEGQLCARAFQSSVGCVDALRGQLRWSRPASGSTGLAADSSAVYGSESNGRVQAWKLDGGEPLWQTDLLLNRGLTAPVALPRAIAVGDAFGYLHLLSPEDGRPLNRLATDGSAIAAAPLLAGRTLLALTRKGGVYAWRIE